MTGEIPKKKQTSLGLYATAKEAYAMWQSDPENTNIIDVRTPEEYYFVGHAEMAINIPVGFVRYQWNPEKKEPAFVPNPNFMSSMNEKFKLDDKLLVMCRSGGRSALTVDALAKAGFKNAYNVIDGMEGDMVKDPNSPDDGRRLKNGWKNSGLPWTYEVDPELLWLSVD